VSNLAFRTIMTLVRQGILRSEIIAIFRRGSGMEKIWT